jgi:hypothetical protein
MRELLVSAQALLLCRQLKDSQKSEQPGSCSWAFTVSQEFRPQAIRLPFSLYEGSGCEVPTVREGDANCLSRIANAAKPLWARVDRPMGGSYTAQEDFRGRR